MLAISMLAIPQSPIPQAVANLLNHKGQFVRLGFVRDLKVRKSCPGVTIRKATIMTVRIGVNYDNMKAVQEKRESGDLPEENQGLMGENEWYDFPYIIVNRKTDNWKLRCAVVPGHVPETAYMRNGVQVSKEACIAECLASEFQERSGTLEVFDIGISNIRLVNGERV